MPPKNLPETPPTKENKVLKEAIINQALGVSPSPEDALLPDPTASDPPSLTVIPGGNQTTLASEMLEEVQEILWGEKYRNMTNATVLGVLEMAKMNYWQSF